MPIGLLLGLPLLLRLPLTEILRSMPDIGYWLVCSALVGFATAVYKAWLVYQHPNVRRRPVVAASGISL